MSKKIPFDNKKMEEAFSFVLEQRGGKEEEEAKEDKVVYSWEELFFNLGGEDQIWRASLFLQLADAYYGEQIKTKEQLEELTGVEDSQKKEGESYSLFLTGRLDQYREALWDKIKEGTTWKELLSLSPKLFALPAPPWEGAFNDSGKWTKEKVVAETSLSAFGVSKDLARGIMVGVAADALQAPYKLLLSYAVELTDL